MRIATSLKLLSVAVIAGAASTLLATTFNGRLSAKLPERVTGDYVESRTATVYCGACHFNGQLVSTGHDAVLAWNFTGGTYRGVSLKGVRAMAAVTAGENLKLNETPHRAQLVVDTSATSEQVAAVAALIQEKCPEMGTIEQVGRAPIAFSHDSLGYKVTGLGFATLDISYRTDDGCCKQPGYVWYETLSPTANRKVGFTESASFSGTIAPPWTQAGDDNAFYGEIAF